MFFFDNFKLFINVFFNLFGIVGLIFILIMVLFICCFLSFFLIIKSKLFFLFFCIVKLVL